MIFSVHRLIGSEFNFQPKNSIENRIKVLYTDVYRRYNSFFDFKTKRILKIFSFFIFQFHNQNWKKKELFEISFFI